jgi:ribosome-associated translation inhibitor RaiA
MQIPLQVNFEGCKPSDAGRAAIEHEMERLETHNHKIIGCRVTVTAPSLKHRHGSGFQIHIWLTLPPYKNIVVNHAPSDDARYEHVEVAVKDAFAAARQQVDDLAPKS